MQNVLINHFLSCKIVLSKKYLYIIVSWGGEPVVYRTKKSLVNHLGKNNSRIVDSWFEKSWFTFIENNLIVRVEIPKVKSKIR